jgi:hypothetical protein
MWGPLEGLAVLGLPKPETGHGGATPRRTKGSTWAVRLVARLIAVIRAD